jgi:hypothetical protein
MRVHGRGDSLGHLHWWRWVGLEGDRGIGDVGRVDLRAGLGVTLRRVADL